MVVLFTRMENLISEHMSIPARPWEAHLLHECVTRVQEMCTAAALFSSAARASTSHVKALSYSASLNKLSIHKCAMREASTLQRGANNEGFRSAAESQEQQLLFRKQESKQT